MHIGPHKTGSTYLQNRLLTNQDSLLSHGWTYPAYGLRQFGHHRLYLWLAGREAAAGDVTEAGFMDLLERHPRILLSSEEFAYLRPDRLQRLKAMLPDTEVRIVYFIRSPVDLWPSHWQELVRHGRDDTLLEYLATYAGLTRVFEPAGMNPIAHLTKYADAFGRDALSIICYDNVVQEGGDIFDLVWSDCLGLKEAAPPGEKRIVHASQKLDMIEMLRSLNQLYREQNGKTPNDRILAAYQKQQETIESAPEYDTFRKAFTEHAAELRLSGRQEILRTQERRLLNLFGTQILNKAADDRLYNRDFPERTVPYAQRFWTDKFGLASYVAAILSGLDVD
jgi:hypothetical protein